LFPDAHSLTFNWGPWDGGMVTPELKRMFAQRGVYVIPLEAGAKLFVSELAAANNRSPQILVGNDMVGGESGAGKESAPLKPSQTSRLSRAIRLADNPFIADHVIGGNPVMPTVCATVWMAHACEQLYPGYGFVGFSNYQLYKGIVFDGSEADRYYLDSEVLEITNSGLLLKATIWSEVNLKGQTLRKSNYAATVEMRKQLPGVSPLPRPRYENMNLSNSDGETRQSLYSNGTLFHGESFQGIEQVLNFSEAKLTLKCRATEVPPDAQGQFAVGTTNPFADDLFYQAMLVWARRQYNRGSLPSSVKQFVQYKAIPPGTDFYLSLDTVSHHATQLEADVTAHDADGLVYSQMSGAVITISKSLNKQFEKNGAPGVIALARATA
jgi:hypothetical protein